jgi:anaerobic selenocysteine-containing dehydrogenase
VGRPVGTRSARQDRHRTLCRLKSGEVKAVWIACTNPAQSLPDQAEVRAALQAAEFVVLQEAYANTDTAAYADLLLPATTWGEKEGTVTNSERRITHLPAVAPPGEARHDWQIAVDFARRLGPGSRRWPANCFPTTTRSRSSTSIARARAGATSTSPA